MKLILFDLRKLTEQDIEDVRIHFPLRYRQAMKYRREEAKKQCIGAGALLLRFVQAREEEILHGIHGKPFLKGGPAFNLSHAGHYTVLALGDPGMRSVGVDIEEEREFHRAAAARVCTEEEMQWLESAPDQKKKRFTALWTVKESILKCEGSGFSEAPKLIDGLAALSGKQVTAFGHDYRVFLKEIGSYHLTLSSVSPIERLDWVEYEGA